MCLIGNYIQKTNLPKSVFGWNVMKINDYNLTFKFYNFIQNIKYNTTYTSTNDLIYAEKKDRHGFFVDETYKSGFHIYRDKDSCRCGYNDVVIPCVGWGLKCMGYDDYDMGPSYRTYVCKYIRLFEVEREAREFKSKLDSRLSKKENKCA